MNEKPLERLNYYNGQRLEASDLKTEQEYHIRTRRWLNKSLYSAGIARGLEVRIIIEGPKEGTPYVSVSPGLALDNEGREIILLEEQTVEVCSFAGTDASTVVGNYLVIEYAEETIAYEKGGCAVRTEGKGASKSTAPMGGPSRIQSTVKFSWVPFVPHPGSNQVVLARVELADECEAVKQVDAGERRYIGAASAATVKQYALEGEREVAFIPKESFPDPKPSEDISVVGKINFHIRGRQPNALVLYLRAHDFNPLYYIELGNHSHSGSLSGDVGITKLNTEHRHSAGTITTDDNDRLVADKETPDHSHTLWARMGITGSATVGNHNAIMAGRSDGDYRRINELVEDDNWSAGNFPYRLTIEDGGHNHEIKGNTGSAKFIVETHTHSLNGISAQISSIGVSYPARFGESLTFVESMQIFIGATGSAMNHTINIQQQLADSDPINWLDGAGNLKILGDGSGNHALALSGTGPIRLDFLPGMTFAEGEYCIELRVASKTDSTGKVVANGGKIHYNLYIE